MVYLCQVIEIRHELFRQYSYYGVITYVNIRIILDAPPPRPRGFVNRPTTAVPSIILC